ncbi:MAG: hypothetical protein AB7P52_02025 [Alphaproteobacteria bacterium]
MSSRAEMYEVQTLKQGRWTIQSRCRSEEQAIAEAHEYFDRRQCVGVKVVKEAFDDSAKLYREHTVFRLPSSAASANRVRTDAPASDKVSEAPAHSPQPLRRRSLLAMIAGVRP